MLGNYKLEVVSTPQMQNNQGWCVRISKVCLQQRNGLLLFSIIGDGDNFTWISYSFMYVSLYMHNIYWYNVYYYVGSRYACF